MCYSRHDMGEEDIQDGADQQRYQDTDGHVPFRIPGFLGSRADRVEAQKGEKDNGGSAQDAREAVFAYLPGIFRNVWYIVFGLDELPSQDDEDQDNGNLEEDDESVEERAARRSPHQDEAHQDHDDHGGDVDDTSIPRTGRKGMGQVDADSLEEDHQVPAPTDTHRRGGYGIFQHQVPSDYPGDELTHGSVGIGIGTTGYRNHGSELGVAESGETATDGGNDE